MSDLEWDWLRSFVAVAESESMRTAARLTGVSQPTLSRHVQRLEEQLGVTLFDRSGRGLTLSPRGTELYESARDVKHSVDGFLRKATGMESQAEGAVRITCSYLVGMFLLPDWLREFQECQPGIQVELVLEEQAVDLAAREAEIAVRMFRPAQLDLTASRRGTNWSVFCASKDYVAQHGGLTQLSDIHRHRLIGFDRLTVYLETAASMGIELSREDFCVRTDSVPGQYMAARAGLGLAVMSAPLVERTPELVALVPQLTLAEQEVWLVAHPDVRRNHRVRTTWEDLGAFLSEIYSRPS